jgi:thiol:disulfide interchange protein DsbD
MMQRFLLLGLIWLASMASVHAAEDFLEPEKAFVFSARKLDDQTIEISYDIAKGYYLYRERFAFRTDNPAIKLGEPQIPRGKIKFDETFAKEVETYRDKIVIRIPVLGAGAFKLESTSQGCADAGLCYPPMKSTAAMTFGGSAAVNPVTPVIIAPGNSPPGNAVQASTPAPVVIERPAPTASTAPPDSEIESVFQNRSLPAALALFFGLGLLLTFTPCVLPMVPILSSIIVGEGDHLTRRRGFILSLAYVLGMALVYTAVGVAAGLIGQGLTSALQNPWVIGTFGVLLVALALSMFDVYHLRMPAFLHEPLHAIHQRQQGGRLLGVFFMGSLSALIVSPCVTAPLAATLTYIARTHDAVFGGSVLFVMALGMGAPLLLIGLGAGSLLPRAGAWMQAVKHFFGVLLLGVALWTIAPILPAWASMLLWALLLILSASFLSVFDPLPQTASAPRRLGKGLGVVAVLLGALLLVGVASGGRDVLQPLDHLRSGQTAAKLPFERVRTMAELEQRLASLQGKPAVLDFYADWCVSCKEMEKFTFTDPKVAEKLQGFVRLQVDVTGNNADDQALLKRFNLFGPPGIILFNPAGQEVATARVIGFQAATQFLASLRKVLP